jgi:hypothetical protein
METSSYLRRQAAFYLRLSEFCPDDPIADHLRFKAADYHQRALRSEFNIGYDGIRVDTRFASAMASVEEGLASSLH